jgi:hypothetical protein
MKIPSSDVRTMLALLSKPELLETNSLALSIREALGVESVQNAVERVIDMTFERAVPQIASLKDVIRRCDLGNEKRLQAASSLCISTRTLYRRRADAIALVGLSIDKVLANPNAGVAFRYAIAKMISPVEPETAVRLLQKETGSAGGRAAYDAVCARVRNGSEVDSALLERCTGHWRLLAEIEIARSNLVTGAPQQYERVRPQITAALSALSSSARPHVAFELAYVDRLDAVRRCDVDAAAIATRELNQWAQVDRRFSPLALVCEVEQACDEGELIQATTLVEKLQSYCVRTGDFRISARASHVSGILSFLKGQYGATIDYCEATVAALSHVEPEFAACSAAIAGRAALLAGKQWERPSDLCARFPFSYVTGIVDAVWARHLALSDPERALPIAERVVALVQEQRAYGVLAFARGTLAIINRLLARQQEAIEQSRSAWADAIRLRRRLYLHDLLIHPALEKGYFGPFDFEQQFLSTLSRRLARLIVHPALGKTILEWTRAAILECIGEAGAVVEGDQTDSRRRKISSVAVQAFRRIPIDDQYQAGLELRRLSSEMSYYLPTNMREPFGERFTAATQNLLGEELIA